MLDVDALAIGDRVRFAAEWGIPGRVVIPAGALATVMHVPDDDARRIAVVPDDITLQAPLTLWHGEVVRTTRAAARRASDAGTGRV